MRQGVMIQGVELRRRGDMAELLVKVAGEWRLVISEYLGGQFGHASYAAAIRKAPLDPMSVAPNDG